MVTAITICDVAHFIVDDPDRLLDGTFTVLGKVISTAEEDVPTLSRNKLLRNLSATAFDEAISGLDDLLAAAPEVGGTPPGELLDFKIDSRVSGSSFRVLPLAIYT